mmetsp:Transcript_39108/g.74939  ORF Transcript_39108/g.74939 Transcript_39108/m.74939 type:complete len:221 (-) Transcript_39108:354-1016(-)
MDSSKLTTRVKQLLQILGKKPKEMTKELALLELEFDGYGISQFPAGEKVYKKIFNDEWDLFWEERQQAARPGAAPNMKHPAAAPATLVVPPTSRPSDPTPVSSQPTIADGAPCAPSYSASKRARLSAISALLRGPIPKSAAPRLGGVPAEECPPTSTPSAQHNENRAEVMPTKSHMHDSAEYPYAKSKRDAARQVLEAVLMNAERACAIEASLFFKVRPR